MQFVGTKPIKPPLLGRFWWHMAMWCIPGSTTEGNPKEVGSNPILAIMGGG